MGLEEAGNVIYYGIIASFFGGWIPIRSKDLKLIVFHLYLFLSMLLLPLIIYLVDSTRVVGWVLYGTWTLLVFATLKIMNYRLHKALGTDPEPEPEPQDSEHEEEEVVEDKDKEDNTASESVDRGLEEGEKMAEVVILDDEEEGTRDHSLAIRRHSSSSNFNELIESFFPQQSQNPGTPEIELSQLSQIPAAALDGITEGNITTAGRDEIVTSPMVTNNIPTETVPIELENNLTLSSTTNEDERASSSNRQRICHRYSRNESLRRQREQINNSSSLSPDTIRQYVIDNHPYLAPVIDKMPTQVHESIYNEMMSAEVCQGLAERLSILQNCHLASDSDDNTAGAIHWYEEGGQWDFYNFDPSPIDEDSLDPHFQLAQALLFRTASDTLRRPTPPPKPVVTPGSYEDHTLGSSELVPSILLIPKIPKTKINLNFARSRLEEYMDRNVSRVEVAMAIFLAVMVCIISSLLLTLTDFFHGFWIFALCFVVATSHFSLIKSVQSDPASPSPGQNRINALSRSIYFIVIGSLGLLLDGVLRHTTTFTPACLYGFNYNNEFAIVFVRDGLFIFILSLPLLFTLGWMPQFDTFLITVLEHIELHVFGGTASTGLVCSIYSLIRNVLVILALSPLGYLAFVTLEMDADTSYIGSNCSLTFSTYSDGINHCSTVGRIAFSFFLASIVSVSYILSRATSNHQYLRDLLTLTLKKCWHKIRHTHPVAPPTEDPLDKMYLEVIRKRLLSDILVAVFIFIATTLINLTSLFCQNEIVAYVIYGITAVLGIFNHYFLPHFRKEMPYLCFTEPCIKSNEYGQFEITEQPKVSIIERILQVFLFVEKNIFYPLTFLFGLNLVAVYYRVKFGEIGAAFVVSIVGMKLFRSAYSELPRQHIVLILSLLFFNVDYAHLNEGLPFNYFIMAILFSKIYDLYLKIYFILIYIMPGSWSSPFHIIIQPLLIPHCPLIFFETLIASIVSAPMNPIIASSMFFLSYARPIKFWEKDYNTKRRDTSNTRLEQQLDSNFRNPNPDHLDSLFYEQLSWSLQRDLCGDIMLGRWGRVLSGDFYILTNDQLNALVHIIEVGNGFVTFQLRGLEFRGTYCHQREREIITEPIVNSDSCCHLPYMLPCNKALSSRWMTWEVISSCYTLHGYSISENQAHLVFNAYDYKKAFITYYVKSIIYFLIKYPQLPTMLDNTELKSSLFLLSEEDSIDLDPLFDQGRNIDWKFGGIRRTEFISCYHDFIKNCANKHLSPDVDTSRESFVVTLCYAYSLLGRRMFFTHANVGTGRRGDNFIHGLYRMFLGDARPSPDKDDWILHDVESIQQVIIPAARIALKVHQDNFTMSDQYESSEGVYEAIKDAEENHVITHENDKAWRDGVVLDRPSLLALRYQRTEDTYIHPYKIIRLTSKFIKFRVVKVNRESVRSLWSSQQHELIFLRNSNAERGSIQNHKATLRNMINSSMDLPIGYPIYVSPLQTSFLDRHKPFNHTHMGRLSNPLDYIKFVGVVKGWCSQCAQHYQGSRNNQARPKEDSTQHQPRSSEVRLSDSITGTYQYEDPFGGDSDSEDEFWKPIWIGKQVAITNEDEIFFTFNEHWLQWPDKSWPHKAVPGHWGSWRPGKGTVGQVIHEWRPFHITSTSRSHIDKIIVLMRANDGDNLVLIKEQGINEV